MVTAVAFRVIARSLVTKPPSTWKRLLRRFFTPHRKPYRNRLEQDAYAAGMDAAPFRSDAHRDELMRQAPRGYEEAFSAGLAHSTAQWNTW